MSQWPILSKPKVGNQLLHKNFSYIFYKIKISLKKNCLIVIGTNNKILCIFDSF